MRPYLPAREDDCLNFLNAYYCHMDKSIYLADLNSVGLKDIDQVGGKNASLGEMLQNLTSLGIQIPNGFIITVAAYREFIHFNNLDQ